MFARKIAFDALTFTYTLGLIAYTIFPISQELFILHFSALAGWTLAALLASALLSALAHWREFPTIGSALFQPTRANKRFLFIHLALLFFLTLYISIRVTEASFIDLLDRDGLTGAWRLWSGLSQPNLALLPKALAHAGETILIAFLATLLAIPAAFLFAFFSAKNLMTGPVAILIYSFARLLLNVTRSVEPLIWALIFTVWVGVGPFAGMLALMVHSIASLTKYYSEIIENVNEGPLDAIRSTGARPVQVIWYAVVPQVFLPYIAMTVYLWDTNVRMATVIGLVGGGGIGTLLIQYQGQAQWPEVGCIILVVACIVWLMDTASAYIREALK